MDKLKMEEKELKEKIEFCSLLIKYGNLVGASSEQSIKAFKLKDNFEEELRVLKLKWVSKRIIYGNLWSTGILNVFRDIKRYVD